MIRSLLQRRSLSCRSSLLAALAVLALTALAAEQLAPGHHVHLGEAGASHHHHSFLGNHHHHAGAGEEPAEPAAPREPTERRSQDPRRSVVLSASPLPAPRPTPSLPGPSPEERFTVAAVTEKLPWRPCFRLAKPRGPPA